MKLPWFRTAPGAITLSGVNDSGKGSFRGDVTEGQGPTGFQPSLLRFAPSGCWSITGRHEDGSILTFRLWVPDGGG